MATTITGNSPIVLSLLNNGIPMQNVIMNTGFSVKPSNIVLNRYARGSIFNTASSAFLDDFGEGVPTLNISGNTGFGSEFGSGFLTFKNLELMFSTYLRLRQSATANPDRVILLYFDTLNAEAFSCYPLRFTLTRSAQSNPHLFYYHISLVVLADYLEDVIFEIEDIVTAGIAGNNAVSNIVAGLTGLVSAFSGLTVI